MKSILTLPWLFKSIFTWESNCRRIFNFWSSTKICTSIHSKNQAKMNKNIRNSYEYSFEADVVNWFHCVTIENPKSWVISSKNQRLKKNFVLKKLTFKATFDRSLLNNEWSSCFNTSNDANVDFSPKTLSTKSSNWAEKVERIKFFRISRIMNIAFNKYAFSNKIFLIKILTKSLKTHESLESRAFKKVISCTAQLIIPRLCDDLHAQKFGIVVPLMV